jgi:penicillin-binding protein 1C
VKLREIADETTTGPRETRRLMDPIAAWHVGNVLLGAPPPENAVHNRLAFKTGTSYGYRDAWAVGFDGRMTVGVWVGRPDGAPVPGLVGRNVAAPILFDAFARSGQLPAPLAKAPRGTLIAVSAKLPQPLQRFRPAGEAVRAEGEAPPRIQFPLNGSRLELTAAPGGQAEPLTLKMSGGVGALTVLVNGLPAGEAGPSRQRLIAAPGPGFVRLTVMDSRGTADTVVVRIQ